MLSEEELQRLIHLTFPVEPVYDAAIDEQDDTEGGRCRSRFHGRPWTSVSADEADKWFDCVHWLPPQAFQYFVPAFVRAALSLWEDSNLHIWLSDALDPKFLSKEEFRVRIEAMSHEQRQVVARCIEYLDRKHRGGEYGKILRRYWKRYLEKKP